jgi:hypothetical protein
MPMSKDQGKLTLAAYALNRFTVVLNNGDPDYEPWTMKGLFAPMSEVLDAEAAMVKAGTQKTWQRGFLGRLTKYELVEKVQINEGHGVAYRVTEDGRDVLLAIKKEVGKGVPKSLRWLVFPQNYDPTPEVHALIFPETASEEGSEEEEEEGGMDGVLVQLLQVTSSLQENTIELRKEVKDLREHNEVLCERVSTVFQALQEHHKAVAEGVASMLQSAETISIEVGELSSQLSVRDRLEQLKGRLHVWSTQNHSLLQGIRSCAAQENEIKAAIELLMEKESVRESKAESATE